jgi:tetratricopeptide (TPR) repeat protein
MSTLFQYKMSLKGRSCWDVNIRMDDAEKLSYEGFGETEKAAESWKRAAARPESDPKRIPQQAGNAAAGASAQTYYQGLALEKLGQEEKAKELFRELLQFGEKESAAPTPSASGGGEDAGREVSPRVRTANAHYLAGLGYLGLNDRVAAKAELQQAAQLSPDLLGPRTALASLP